MSDQALPYHKNSCRQYEKFNKSRTNLNFQKQTSLSKIKSPLTKLNCHKNQQNVKQSQLNLINDIKWIPTLASDNIIKHNYQMIKKEVNTIITQSKTCQAVKKIEKSQRNMQNRRNNNKAAKISKLYTINTSQDQYFVSQIQQKYQNAQQISFTNGLKNDHKKSLIQLQVQQKFNNSKIQLDQIVNQGLKKKINRQQKFNNKKNKLGFFRGSSITINPDQFEKYLNQQIQHEPKMALASNNISINCAQSSKVTILTPSNKHIFRNKNDRQYHHNNKSKNSQNDSKNNKNVKKSKISSSTNEQVTKKNNNQQISSLTESFHGYLDESSSCLDTSRDQQQLDSLMNHFINDFKKAHLESARNTNIQSVRKTTNIQSVHKKTQLVSVSKNSQAEEDAHKGFKINPRKKIFEQSLTKKYGLKLSRVIKYQKDKLILQRELGELGVDYFHIIFQDEQVLQCCT